MLTTSYTFFYGPHHSSAHYCVGQQLKLIEGVFRKTCSFLPKPKPPRATTPTLPPPTSCRLSLPPPISLFSPHHPPQNPSFTRPITAAAASIPPASSCNIRRATPGLGQEPAAPFPHTHTPPAPPPWTRRPTSASLRRPGAAARALVSWIPDLFLGISWITRVSVRDFARVREGGFDGVFCGARQRR